MAGRRLPHPSQILNVVRALEQYPFGSLVLLLLILAVALLVWVSR